MLDLALIAAVTAIVAAGRRRLEDLPFTAPMLFVLAGVLMGSDVIAVLDLGLENESVALLAEFTLALLLFADASRIDVRRLRSSIGLPLRLLVIGLPLTIAFGTVVTALLLSDLTWAQAALVAAILAPTDAALGEAVVTDEAVPGKVRQALNVESGLNDGLVVPAVAIFLSLAVGEELDGAGSLIGEAVAEIGIGLALGAAGAFVMSSMVMVAMERDWSDAEGYRLLTLAGAAGVFAGASAAGGNGFIAAFVCGLALRAFVGAETGQHAELAEDAAQVGASATFVVFGALLVVPALDALTVPVTLCAIGTLTLGRMMPVWIALLGTHLRFPTVAFIGWFGPRGLASIVFGLLVLQDDRLAERSDLFSVIVLVVLASIVLHGVTATPLARRYGRWFDEHRQPDMMESRPVAQAAVRGERAG